MLSYLQFLRNASEYVDVGTVPGHVKRAAYNVFTSLPAPASLALAAYEAAEDPEAKVACELIGANIVKTSAGGAARYVNPAIDAVVAGTVLHSAGKKFLKDPRRSTINQGDIGDLPELSEGGQLNGWSGD